MDDDEYPPIEKKKKAAIDTRIRLKSPHMDLPEDGSQVAFMLKDAALGEVGWPVGFLQEVLIGVFSNGRFCSTDLACIPQVVKYWGYLDLDSPVKRELHPRWLQRAHSMELPDD
jgi:hypothetical protein